jgi:hypothetical protein
MVNQNSLMRMPQGETINLYLVLKSLLWRDLGRSLDFTRAISCKKRTFYTFGIKEMLKN